MANSSSCSSSANQTLPGTSSTCSTQSITLTHDFVVNDFSKLDGMGVGKYVSSGTFSVGGTDWNIQLFPDGIDTIGYVAVRLSFLRGPNDTMTRFSFSLLGEDDQASRKKGRKNKKRKEICIVSREGKYTFNSQFSIWWCWPEFISKSKIRELLLNSNDCFTIRCVLTVLTSRTEDAATIAVPPSSLHQDLARMLRDADGADVTIKVGDRFFLAHKYVLAARCSVFKAQLFGVMRESNTECIQIEDMEPSVFERLLHFVYTDSLSEKYEGNKLVAMLQLLVAADRYGLNRLSVMCEEKLRCWINVHSVAMILALAEQHHRGQLKEACLKFIAWPDVLGAIMETQGFKDLVVSCPTIMKDILSQIAWPKLDD